VRDEIWPTPVVKLGRLIKIPSEPLLALIAGRWPAPDANPNSHGGPSVPALAPVTRRG
jgi:hypothetical protein